MRLTPSPTVVRNQAVIAQIRRLATHLSNVDKKNNDLLVSSLKLPKLNIPRNQRRFNMSLNALQLYIDSQFSSLPPQTKAVLSKLAYTLSVKFDSDPAKFIIEMKSISN